MTVYLRPVDAERAQPCCTDCNWAGEPDSDRRAAAAVWAPERTYHAVPTDDDTDTDDGAS